MSHWPQPAPAAIGQPPDSVYQEQWRTITTGGIWKSELLNRKKNGDINWEKTSISPIRDAQGQINHLSR